MDYNRIKDLLDKYLEGKTSVEEETELGTFFISNKDVPKDLAYAQAMFSFISKEKAIEYHRPIAKKQNKRNRLYYITGIAASLLVVMFLVFSNYSSEEKIIYAYINGKPIYDKEIATDYSRQALLAVSQNLDQGTKNLNHLSKINKVEQIIKKK